jgi:peroxiredoxin
MNWNRIALILLMGALLIFATAEYFWVQTPRAGGARRTLFAGAGGCPADPTAREDHGQTDYDWPLYTLDGTPTHLSRFREQAVFINVWATWCGPCVREMPEIQALYDTMSQEGVAFLLVSEEDGETVRTWVEQRQFTFPVYTTQQVPEAFESRGIPATFVVDRQGNIVFKRVGAAQWNNETCYVFLRSLLPPRENKPAARPVSASGVQAR